MEKEQNSELYVPFAGPQLREAARCLREKTSSTGKYKIYSRGEKIINEFFPRLIEGVEKFIGPVYSFIDGGSNVIPERWLPLLGYLKKKKIISEISPGSFFCDTPKFVGFIARAREDFRVMDISGKIVETGITSFGADCDDVDLAISKTIGEALERSQLASGGNGKSKKYSINELRKRKYPFLNPQNVVGYSQKQKEEYPKLKYTDSSIFNWSEGRSLFTGKKTLIPDQLIFWNYLADKVGEPFLREPNTNGAGGHYTRTDTILSGLYELIQRDGFFIYWLNSLSPRRIELDFINSEKLKKLIAQCKDFNFEVVFLDITADLEVPNCVCVLLDNSGVGPKITVGIGCGMDWEDIMQSSLLEALGIYSSTRSRMETKNFEGKEKCLSLDEEYIPFKDSRVGQYDRLEIWADEKMFAKFEFFIQGEKISLKKLKEKQNKFSSSEDELEFLVRKFKAKGKEYEIFYFQVKNEILDSVGYSVVRVIVPALMPIYLNEVNITLGSNRLEKVPSEIGFIAAEKLNPWPHPFV